MIQHLYINNYRCLENFDLPISGRPSLLLIGKNGAGKSTVRIALEMLQRIGRGQNRIKELAKPSDFGWGHIQAPLSIEIEAKLGGAKYEYRLALELPEGFKELSIFEERLLCDGSVVYSRNKAQVVLSRKRKNDSAKFLVDWHLVALPIIQEQSPEDPLHVFKQWLAHMLILAPFPSHIGGESQDDNLTPNCEVTNFAEWFSGLLAYSPSAYTTIDKYLKQVMPDLSDIKNPQIGGTSRSLSVQFKQDAKTLSLPFADLSDGGKCFFICALVLASQEAYGPLFCFWDEPDNYLSPSEVWHFVMALRRAFESGGQLVVTSHNPEAIRGFSNENTFVLHRRSHLEPTVIRPLSSFEINGDLSDALIHGDLEQ